MILWMKKNIITSTINWWAKKSSPILFLFIILSIVFACNKKGNFDLGNTKPNNYTGIVFSDTFTVLSKTLLLNDSLVSATSSYLNFGYYNDPVMGGISSEAYCTLTLQSQNISYSGAQVDSGYLYINYSYAYGDTNSVSSVSIHEITTQLGLSVPYKTNSNFVTYNSAVDGVYQNIVQSPPLTAFTSRVVPGSNFIYSTIPNSNKQLAIPLTPSFGSYLLGKASNNSNTDFNALFYGIVIKRNENWLSGGSVIRADFTSDYDHTRLIIYYHVGNQSDSASFGLNYSSPSFNRVVPYFSGNLALLKNNRDSISSDLTNGNCFIQSGTGVVTKIQIPYLTKLESVNDTSVIINKALLYVPIESTPPYCDLQQYMQNSPIALIEVNPDNSYKYRPTGLAVIQATGAAQFATGHNLLDTATFYTTTNYMLDITSYVQAILSNKAVNTTYIVNNGFVIVPAINSYLINRSVIHSSTAVSNPMKLELYYTKVK